MALALLRGSLEQASLRLMDACSAQDPMLVPTLSDTLVERHHAGNA